MNLDYSSFLSPFASPSLGKIDVSGLEDAGKMLEQRAQYDQNRQDRLQKEARDYALEQSATEGKNRYYDAQAQTHRLAQEQLKNAASEKRNAALFDAFRKAKTPGDRKAILDELQRNGFTVEESASDLPDTSAPAAPMAEAPAVAAPKAAKPGKAPKPNAKFMAALGQIVADDNAQEQPVDESSVGPGSLASVLGVPGAGAMSGDGMAASPQQEIAAPTGGGKFVIKDKSGVVVHSYDEPLERMKSQSIVNSAMGGLKEAAQTERERAAADAAVKAAAGLVDGGVDLDKAARLGLDTYQRTLAGEFKKVYPQGKGGAGAAPMDLKKERYEGEERNRIINRVGSHYNIKAADEVANFAQRAIDKLNIASGVGDFGAFADWLKEESGKVVTDKEREQFMSAAGGFTGLMNKVDRWTQGGRFDPQYMGEVRQLMETIQRSIEAQKAHAAEIATGEAAGSGLSQKSVDVVGGHFSGKFQGSARPKEDTRSDEELLRNWTPGKK